jgi:hypothetical protein
MKKTRVKTVTWNVYVVRAKLTWLGTVEAATQADAIAKAVERFQIRRSEAWRISVRRK